MSSVAQVLKPEAMAAIPTAIAILQANDQFITDMGTNPVNWVANYPGAKMKELGSVQLALAGLIPAEGAAVVGQVRTFNQSLIAKLQAIQAAAAAPAAPAPAAVLAATTAASAPGMSV